MDGIMLRFRNALVVMLLVPVFMMQGLTYCTDRDVEHARMYTICIHPIECRGRKIDIACIARDKSITHCDNFV